MGWSIGFDTNWQRDIGYGVPAYCDHPGCMEEIDRGLAYVCCGEEPYGGEHGCGLYFCSAHLYAGKHGFACERCRERGEDDPYEPFTPTPDHPEWTHHKLTDPSWAEWREENPEWVVAARREEGA